MDPKNVCYLQVFYAFLWDRKNKIRNNFLLLLLFYITHVVVQLGPRVECCNE